MRAASGQGVSTSGQPQAPASLELPYTIAAPESYEEFAKLVAGRSAADLSAAIQRIMACNSAALATENRRKLQVRAALDKWSTMSSPHWSTLAPC